MIFPSVLTLLLALLSQDCPEGRIKLLNERGRPTEMWMCLADFTVCDHDCCPVCGSKGERIVLKIGVPANLVCFGTCDEIGAYRCPKDGLLWMKP